MQNCTPFVYMDSFLHQLARLTGPTWIQECVTLYADDLHIGCRFISYTKSFVILGAAGTNPRAALKGVLHRDQHGAHIEIPRATGKLRLPLRAKGTYLGVIMSYRSFEAETWKRRKQARWIAFNRLLQWLKAKSIPVQHRIYLWHTGSSDDVQNLA